MKTTNNQLEEVLLENQRLRKDNEMLLDIMVQMKVTLNRLLNRYVTEQTE